jgi:hypothetical protein
MLSRAAGKDNSFHLELIELARSHPVPLYNLTNPSQLYYNCSTEGIWRTATRD